MLAKTQYTHNKGDKDESVNLETTNLSKAFDSDEIRESTSSPHGDSAATKTTKTLGSSNDVFVSFRGEDIRNSFTDHLNNALKEAEFSTSLDIEVIHRDIRRQYRQFSLIVDNTSRWTDQNVQSWKEVFKDVADMSGMFIS
ncbi:variation in compound triggered root growth response-like protein, partial [Tanacetum coccineum]